MIRIRSRNRTAILAVSGALLFLAGQASAHTQLVSADPAPNASVAAPTTITLRFNEALETKVSNVKLSDGAGKAVTVSTAKAPDTKSMAATTAAPLGAGKYTVAWTAVGGDGHPMKGTYSFTVK